MTMGTLTVQRYKGNTVWKDVKGWFSSLRRGPGANTHDQSGYTSLHHSALNGHKDIVRLLLEHEASVNVIDNKGSTPIHLAAWTGNIDIVKLLLEHGPSVPNVNLTNHDHETALHSAAQYGHAEVVSLLLKHESDPSIRNLKEESPLDLAAQYGRLETVELLVKSHLELLRRNVRKHSPLHLASRNGHKQVVKVLLDAGFDVNYLTESGSALHEAATFGKVDVVRLLLDYGVNIHLKDSQNRTVLDILEDLNTNIAKQTCQIIKDHASLVSTENDLMESPCSVSPPPGFLSGSYANILVPDRTGSQKISPGALSSPGSDVNFYEVPAPLKTVSKRSSGASDIYKTPPLAKSHDSSFDLTPVNSRSPSLYETPPTPREYDGLSFSSSFHSPLTPNDSRTVKASRSSDSDAILYEIPPPPHLGEGKRLSDPTQPSYQTIPLSKSDRDQQTSSWSGTGSYLPMGPSQNKPIPPAKPPRKSVVHPVSPVSRGQPLTRHASSGYEYLCLASTGRRSSDEGNYGRRASGGGSEYVDMKSCLSNYENHDIYESDGYNSWNDGKMNGENTKLSESTFSTLYDEIASGRLHTYGTLGSRGHSAMHVRSASDNTGAPQRKEGLAKPTTIDFFKKRATVQIPLSPTNYQQPPTPDFPPPSPTTAEIGIHEKIKPLSHNDEKKQNGVVEYKTGKRASKDIETLTDDELFASVDSNGGVRLALRNDCKSVSTDNIEEIIEDNPFAGLCRGSTKCPYNCSDDHKVAVKTSILNTPSGTGKPAPPPRRPKNVYENVGIELDSLSKSRVILPTMKDGDSDKRNSLSLMSPFDENAEWAEIADIMASFGSGIARESVFARDMEEQFAQRLTLERKDKKHKEEEPEFNSVEEWLSSIKLSEYENILIINGYDDIKFLGGGVVEDQDLQDIGISNEEHRKLLVLAAEKLPSVPLVGNDKEESIDSWLKSLHLEEYSETFKKNGFTDLERVRKIWEVELNTVLNVTKLGHQRRILASLGERSAGKFIDLNDLDLTDLNINLDELGIDDISPQEKSSEFSLFKDYNAASQKIARSVRNNLSDSEGLKIRPPTQLMSDPGQVDATSPQQLFGGMPASITAQWRHKPEVLIQKSCDYNSQYLGSTLVKELRGTESTRKSIQKLKASTRDIGKIPNVVLSVSYTGVKFIDAQTKQQVCEHEIRNIHCACQDADDLNHFAYITKEHQTNHHYCHVFCAQTMDLATEIILTLGQAFEVAYQLAMKEKTVKPVLNKCDDHKLSEKDAPCGATAQLNLQLVKSSPSVDINERKNST